MTNEGIILDYRDETLVGLTILDISQRESFDMPPADECQTSTPVEIGLPLSISIMGVKD